jgi:hypothetical protein
MKSLKAVLFSLFVILATISVSAQDTFRIGVDYGRKDFKINPADAFRGLDSFRFNALARVAGAKEGDGFKFRAGVEIERTLNQEVFHEYPVPDPLPTSVDIYRDITTYYGLAALAYRRSIFEVEARAGLGTEKPHENLEYTFLRKYQFRGNLVLNNFVVTPLFIEFKRDSDRFTQGFGAGLAFAF